MSKPTDTKIAMFHELRSINSAAYAISLRAKGTPFETRAKQIAKVSGYHDELDTLSILKVRSIPPWKLGGIRDQLLNGIH